MRLASGFVQGSPCISDMWLPWAACVHVTAYPYINIHYHIVWESSHGYLPHILAIVKGC